MELEFLGTGSSFGVPEIGCDCPVCRSDDPRDRRLRCSVWIRHGGLSLIVDTTPDFRQQCLRSGIRRLDAVLMTHMHADHIFGMDDVRKFNRLQDAAIPIHVPADSLERFRRVFEYALSPPPAGLTVPRFDLQVVDGQRLRFGELEVQPVLVDHGSMIITGYVFHAGGKRIAYLTDCKTLPPATVEAVRGADIVILGALWDNDWQHVGHLNLKQARTLTAHLEAKRTWFTHMTHYIGLHEETSATLPADTALAYDGLVVTPD